jgi:hypothetical protein
MDEGARTVAAFTNSGRSEVQKKFFVSDFPQEIHGSSTGFQHRRPAGRVVRLQRHDAWMGGGVASAVLARLSKFRLGG